MTKAANLAAMAQGPAFSVYQSSAQTLSSATWTKLQMQSEVFDTANAFDNATNHRFQPTVAGYYQLTGGLFVSTTQCIIMMSLYKNANQVLNGNQPAGAFSGNSITGLVYLNGTTDFAELYGYVSVGQALTTGQQYNYFQGVLIRAA